MWKEKVREIITIIKNNTKELQIWIYHNGLLLQSPQKNNEVPGDKTMPAKGI